MLRRFQPDRSCLTALLLAVVFFQTTLPRAWAHGDLHERILALTRQIQAHSTNAELWLQRADLSRQHGDHLGATVDTAEALRLRPDWPAAILQQARIQFDAGQSAAAIEAATACLRLDATNSDALVIRARSRAQLGQLAGVVTDYNSVLVPTDGPRPLPDLYLERARAQAALGRPGDAVRGLDEGLVRLGETPSLALPALEYERTLGDFTAALVRLERLRKFFPNETFLALRGEVFLQAHRRAEAENDFLAGLAAVENYPPDRRALSQTQELATRLGAGLRQSYLLPLVKTNTDHAK